MKKLLLTGVATVALVSSAVAADMAMPMNAAPVAIPVYDWTGFYVGGVLGGAWGRTDTSDPGLGLVGTLLNVPAIQTTDSSGFIGGIEGGSRYQFGKLVVGWEADITWGNVDGTSATTFSPVGVPPGAFNLTRSFTTSSNWMATSVSTVGIAHDRWLIYGKAGVAYTHNSYTDNWTGGGAIFGTFPAFSGANSENRTGWTVGAGLEWAVWENWSLKAEYDYIDFGNRTVAINGTVLPGIANFPASFGIDNSQHINVFKAGVNWRFLSSFW